MPLKQDALCFHSFCSETSAIGSEHGLGIDDRPTSKVATPNKTMHTTFVTRGSLAGVLATMCCKSECALKPSWKWIGNIII